MRKEKGVYEGVKRRGADLKDSRRKSTRQKLLTSSRGDRHGDRTGSRLGNCTGQTVLRSGCGLLKGGWLGRVCSGVCLLPVHCPSHTTLF